METSPAQGQSRNLVQVHQGGVGRQQGMYYGCLNIVHWERKGVPCASVVDTPLRAFWLIVRGSEKYEHNVGMTVIVISAQRFDLGILTCCKRVSNLHRSPLRLTL